MYKWLKIPIALIASFFIGFFFEKITSTQKIEEEVVVTKIQIDTVYKTIIDSIPFEVFTEKSKTINVQLDNKKVKTTLNTGEKYFEKLRANLYYSIYAESLYATEFKLQLDEKTILNNQTNNIIRYKEPTSKIFLGGGLNVSQQEIQQIEVGAMYNHKQKWMAGIVINQNLINTDASINNTMLGGRFYIGL